MKGSFWTISNALSGLRIVIALPIALLLYRRDPHDDFLLAGLVLAAVLSDLLDGYLARKRHQVTDVGKIIDPLADKVAVGAVAVVLTMQGRVPGWFVAMVLARDVLIFFGGMYVRHTTGMLLQSHVVGKWAAVVVTAFLCVAMTDIPELHWVRSGLLLCSVFMLLCSFVLYLQRFVHIVIARTI